MSNKLSPQDIFEIKELAQKKRGEYEVGNGPLGDHILKLLRSIGINLISLPIKQEGENSGKFCAFYVRFKDQLGSMRFIGLNTYQYFDKQIFSIAHELYHHWEETEFHICRDLDESSSIRELKANRFAAELLLPSDTLTKEIKSVNKGILDLNSWRYQLLLRFIARLQCDFQLPYKAIVRRLIEIEAINKAQFDKLIKEPVRSSKDHYYLIASQIDPIIFETLNTRTKITDIDGEFTNQILSNYEDNLISLDELAEDLELIDKTLDDFGIMEEVDLEDLDEINQFFLESCKDET
ncbi:ImmA/IrrE family metallo-endopeptidase [Priestia koreensis]|uniref:ImmA/IrrE family metallo-endopeptidase n=1 Tax=Priestia koreensis TaxID=284581 RepID=UPI003CFC2625